MNNLDFIVFDFETGGLDPNFHEAIQIAGKAYHCRTLEPYPAEHGGEFCSLMKPLHPERLSDDALKVNKKTKEELMEAPDQKLVWNQFVEWVLRYNYRKNAWTAPIAAGKNIRSFDLEFVKVLNDKHCPKKDKTVLFSKRRQVDLEDFIFTYFENSTDLANEKLDTICEHFGYSKEDLHDAAGDVKITGDIIMRFLRWQRAAKSRGLVKFQGCMSKAS